MQMFNGWELHLHQSFRSKWIGWEESHCLGELNKYRGVGLSVTPWTSVFSFFGSVEALGRHALYKEEVNKPSS